MPEVSVIVPVYGVEKFLSRCVESLLKQSLRAIEIILVDDGSLDACPAICDAYAEKDSRIKVIHKINAGLGQARNSGLEIATGKYVAFVDSDDYVESDMLQSMYAIAIQNNADFVRCDNYKETEEGVILNEKSVAPVGECLYDRERLRKELLYPQFGLLPGESGERYVSCSVWRNIYRREIIEKNKLRFVSERELISEDILFNLDFMMKSERAYVVSEKFYHYVINESSLTQTYRKDRFQKELILYRAMSKRLKEYGIYEECKIRLYRHLLARARKCLKSELFCKADFSVKKKRMDVILKSDEIENIFNVYPWKELPLKYRFVYLCMKKRSYFILRLIKYKL